MQQFKYSLIAIRFSTNALLGRVTAQGNLKWAGQTSTTNATD